MIPFPRYHIATSVVNRLLNVAHEVRTLRAAPVAPGLNIPDPIPEGQALTQQLFTPPPAMDASPQVAQSIALAHLLR